MSISRASESTSTSTRVSRRPGSTSNPADTAPKQRLMAVHAVIDNRTGLVWYIAVGGTPEQACTVAASMTTGTRDAQYCRAGSLMQHEDGYIVYDASVLAPAHDLAPNHTAVMAQVMRRVSKRTRGDNQHKLEVAYVKAMPLVGLFVRVATPA